MAKIEEHPIGVVQYRLHHEALSTSEALKQHIRGITELFPLSSEDALPEGFTLRQRNHALTLRALLQHADKLAQDLVTITHPSNDMNHDELTIWINGRKK